MTIGTSSPQTELLALEQTLSQAVAQHQAGQLSEAEKRYRAILEINPQHAEANHNMGALSVQMKQSAAGLPYFLAALEADPTRSQYWLSYIDALYQAGQSDDARQMLALAKQQGLQGDDVAALEALLEDGAPTAGQPDMEDSHEGNEPSSREINVLVALFNERRVADAAALAQKMTERYPQHWVGWKMLGVVFQQQGRHADALVAMQKTVALLPGNAESHNNLGITFKNLGRLDESEASYRRALQVNPNYAQAYNNLGATLQDLGRLVEAEACYRKALQIKPDYAQAAANLGATTRQQRRLNESSDRQLDIFAEPGFDEAQALVTRGDRASALKVYAGIGATQAERHYQDALVLEQRNDKVGALGLLKCCVLAQPTHLPALLKQAQLLFGAEAERACRQTLAAFPGNLAASLRLANLLIGRGRSLDAVNVLAAASPTAQDSYDNHFSLASLWWQLGNFSCAELHLRRCIQMNNEDVRPYQILLELLNRQDRITDAEALCREYLKLKPSDQEMRIALANCLVRQQRWNDAEIVLLALIAEFPDWVSITQLYAEMLEKCGRMSEALAILESNVERIPDALGVYLPLADIQYKSGKKELALETCRQISLKYLDSDKWGLHLLPSTVQSRLIFYQLEEVVEKYCAGRRAFFDNTELDIARSDFKSGEVVELFCMVVGQEHIDFLEHVAYPALSSTVDFDKLLAERTVVYNIYTTPADYERLQSFLNKISQRGIRYRVNVELLSFSQELYSILTLPIIDQVKRSLALNSVVIMALPDAIISGSIYRVVKDMKPLETVVCAMPRIDSDIAYANLKQFFADGNHGRLDSREFVRKSMTEFMHPQTYSALVSESNCLRYRDQGTYYSARNWAPPPLCFYARQEMLDHMIRNPLCGPNSIASFYAIDHDFVDSAYRTNNLRLIDDSDYFFWAEFTHSGRHTDFLAGRKSEDYYAPESTQFVFKHEFRWIYGG